ncbi:MAG: hypothetical protein KVP17_004968, partial [Porospora cf. gigantea B]|uniref:uncharacterized protein n=1 Tax=Porospora cf. gigantea B TaxID=2853592 RepID=UPI0035719BBC
MERRRGGPRSREDRHYDFSTNIPIPLHRFPAHIKPPAVIIGKGGRNHARLQDMSDTCIQLRGRGISSKGTPGSDKDLHLYVRYDAEEQINVVLRVLDELIVSAGGLPADTPVGTGVAGVGPPGISGVPPGAPGGPPVPPPER